MAVPKKTGFGRQTDTFKSAYLAGILTIAIPCSAFAQGETPAAPEPEAAPAAEAPAEAAPAEAAPAAPAAEAAPAAAAGGEVAGTVEATKADEKDDRPWHAYATIEQTLGAGAFASAPGLDSPHVAYGYAVTMMGTYEAIPSMLDAFVRIDFDQQLTSTFLDGGTRENEFYFRDMRLGATAGRLYKEEVTGISFGATGDIRLPTSKSAQAVDRILTTNIGAKASRSFEDVGPGTIKVSLTGAFRKDWGTSNPTIGADEAASLVNSCRSVNRSDTGDCFSSISPLNYAISYGVAAGYSFLEDWSVDLALTMQHSFSHNLGESSLANTTFTEADISTSPFAADVARQSDLVIAGLEVGYQINDYVGLGLGVITMNSPFIFRDGDNSAIRFPFFDFETTANNNSTYYLDLNLSY